MLRNFCRAITFGILGEIWEDTVDPAHNGFCPFNQGLTPVQLQKNMEQWYTPYFQGATEASLERQVTVGKTSGTSGTDVKTRWMRAAISIDSGDSLTPKIRIR